MVLEFAYCFDDNNGWQAAISIKSMLMTLSWTENTTVQIYCICTGKKNKQQIDYITRLTEQYETVCVTFFDFNQILIENGYQTRGISVATYIRLFLPDILKNSNTVLYCDCDTLFLDNCRELFDLSMDGCAIRGTVTALNIKSQFNLFKKEPYYESIKSVKGKYINAGIMLLNLDFIRKYGIHQEWEKCISYPYVYQDQDIINIKTHNYIKELPMRYNTCMSSLKYLDQMIAEKLVSEEEFIIVKRRPTIIHYTGDKPWDKLSVTYSELWWNYVLDDIELLGAFKQKLLLSIADTKKEIEKKNNRLKWMKKLDDINVSIVKDCCVSIYAWGDLGKKLYKELNIKGISVKYGIDKRKKYIDDGSEIELYSLDDCLPEVDFVIIAMDYDELDIKRILNDRGFNTLFLEDITK